MESIYYVMSWLCHRACRHCYEDRFRPYFGEELKRVVDEAVRCSQRIIANFPERMTYLDLNDPQPDGSLPEKPGSVILAGGEILLDPVRQPVLYPALETLWRRYQENGGVKLIVQTTGDTLTPAIVAELLERRVWMISVSGLDEYHAGLEEESARAELRDRLLAMLESAGMRHLPLVGEKARQARDDGRYFHFFGATPDMWIGKLWPRGRAHSGELSTAGLADNFCNRWSGGLNFLQYRHSGSEVSIEPNGNVYPCCIKTRMPIGNLLEEKLEAILQRLTGNPMYEAISMGHPERMGIHRGWSVEKFLEKSRVTLPSGKVYQNLCLGCDRFHEEEMGG
jgi:sulfatase maturation enzyme AslB (radical SAM superfamily)